MHEGAIIMLLSRIPIVIIHIASGSGPSQTRRLHRSDQSSPNCATAAPREADAVGGRESYGARHHNSWRPGARTRKAGLHHAMSDPRSTGPELDRVRS